MWRSHLTVVCAYWVDADVCPVHCSEAEMEVDSVSLMWEQKFPLLLVGRTALTCFALRGWGFCYVMSVISGFTTSVLCVVLSFNIKVKIGLMTAALEWKTPLSVIFCCFLSCQSRSSYARFTLTRIIRVNCSRECSWSGFRLYVHTDANANICRNRSRE